MTERKKIYAISVHYISLIKYDFTGVQGKVKSLFHTIYMNEEGKVCLTWKIVQKIMTEQKHTPILQYY